MTGRIYDRLVTAFGRDSVFKDVDDIPFNIDSREYLDRVVSQCQVCLVVIGRTWLETQAGICRLDNPQDFVRIEIESALRRRIPVLVGGVQIPEVESLPSSLVPIAFRNGTKVGSDPDFYRDVERLIFRIQQNFVAVQPSSLSLSTRLFKFEVVTVNEMGQEISRKLEENEYLTQSLDKKVALDLVKISGGTFQMGSNESDDEEPIHTVIVAPFWLGKFPVTQEQYEA